MVRRLVPKYPTKEMPGNKNQEDHNSEEQYPMSQEKEIRGREERMPKKASESRR